MTELQGSIDFIQAHYQKTPIAFVWPGGNFTQRSVQLARYAGYKSRVYSQSQRPDDVQLGAAGRSG